MHSCLSPCGDDDMTPCNLVRMAALAGLQVIAVADHNSVKNSAAAVKVGEDCGVLVVPAMELTCAEEVHVLCLFPELAAAEDFCRLVYSRLPKRKNKPAVFGEQLIMDENDRLVAREEHLLAGAADIGVYDVQGLVGERGGIAVPAHIDRASYSLLANMGIVDPAMDFHVFETTPRTSRSALAAKYGLEGCGFISNSDAHDLTAIMDGTRKLELPAQSAAAVVDAIKGLRTGV